MGAPVAATAESAPPPLAWPSSLVTITPPRSTDCLNAAAWSPAQWNGIELHLLQRATHTIARLTALLTSGLADRCIQDEDGEVRADGLLDSNHLFE